MHIRTCQRNNCRVFPAGFFPDVYPQRSAAAAAKMDFGIAFHHLT